MGEPRPAAARMGAMRREVLSPTPPVECLSTRMALGGRERRSRVTPESRMARVRAVSSVGERPRRKVAMRKAAVWASEISRAVMAATRCWISMEESSWPSRLRRMRSRGRGSVIRRGRRRKEGVGRR